MRDNYRKPWVRRGASMRHAICVDRPSDQHGFDVEPVQIARFADPTAARVFAKAIRDIEPSAALYTAGERMEIQ